MEHLLLAACLVYDLLPDGQKVSIFTIMEGARIEVWPQILCEVLSVSVDVGQTGQVIKRDPPTLIVQEYSNSLRRFFKVECHPWTCKGLVVITSIQA